MSTHDTAGTRGSKNGKPAGSLPDDSGQGEGKHTLLGADATASDADQTTSDLDQTTSDTDQALADRDQEQSDADQDASDRDQAASDREMDANSDGSQDLQDAHDASRDERLDSTIARTVTGFARTQLAEERLEHAAQRDQDAHVRDMTAKARDLAAEALDRAAVAAARRADEKVSSRNRRLHREALKYVGVVAETASAARIRAAADRAQAAKDRERAAMDREQAAADREQARVALTWAHLDDLTGAYQRGVGLAAIQNEIDRVRRGDGRLVLGFVDVDGLKATNDQAGHGAGDELLRAVAEAIRSKMRSYEPIVRFGGDEFVCVLANVDVDAASERFDEIRAVLHAGDPQATISVGLASLEPDDDLDRLIERADRALTKTRGRSRESLS